MRRKILGEVSSSTKVLTVKIPPDVNLALDVLLCVVAALCSSIVNVTKNVQCVKTPNFT